MGNLVPRKSTPANGRDITLAIIEAWKKVFGENPKVSQVAKTWAQISVETGRGAHMFNNNVGNIIWTKGNSNDYFPNTDTRSRNGNPADREGYHVYMRSYETLVDGIVDYLTLLKNRSPVMKSLVHGSPKDFSYALADVKYYDPYTRDDYVDKSGKTVHGYTTGLTSLYNEFLSKYKKNKQQQVSQPQEQVAETNSNDSVIDGFLNKIDNFISKFVTADDKSPMVLIKISSTSSLPIKLEYARVLKQVMKEELNASSQIFSNGETVQLEVNETSATAVKEVSTAVLNVFTETLNKQGCIANISLDFMKNAQSSLPPLNIRMAETNYRLFNMQLIAKEKNGQIK